MTTTADKVFYLSIAGFVAGIFAHSFLDIGAAFSGFFVLLGLAFALLGYLQKQQTLLLAAIVLVAAGAGMFRYDLEERKALHTGIETSVGETVILEGIVVDEPDVREATTQLRFKAEKTTILLFVAHEPRFSYGDALRVEGKLERPKNFTDEKTLREVDYVSHMAKDGIFYQIFRPNVTLIASGQGNIVVEKLFVFKNAFIANIQTIIGEPHASLLGGLVVGAKQSLGKELLEDFRTVGVIHIVVLSGYNITIIAFFIEWLLSRLRRNIRLVLAALAMVLFAVMVGGSATVIRATVMALLALLARGTGRIYAVTRALLVAGVIMLLHNPKILVFDASFQLSFLATLGLIYVSPFVEPRVQWVTERFHLREIVVATIATQLFVLPFLLYKTGLFSIVSLPVNLLILTAIPLTMLFGFLAGMLAFVSTVLALPFAYAAYALLAYELGVVEWFSKLPFASVSVPYIPVWFVVLWYVFYAILFWVWHTKESKGGSPILQSRESFSQPHSSLDY